MVKKLKVLVVGTGFAGKGHVQAFRAAGAEIVGMVGRTPDVVEQVGQSLDIPVTGTDLEHALAVLKPDIVSVATPGGAHFDQIKSALSAGCHVLSGKPLTHNAETAVILRDLARQSGLKTAYAASFQFAASVQHAKRLVENGAIGEPTEVESISHFNLERGIPFGWSHRAEDGGGRLNNNFTHSLAIVNAVIGDDILAICGDVRDDLHEAPIVDGVHDFTQRRNFIPKDLNDPNLDWGQSNVEWSYTVMARVRSPLAKQSVSVLFKHGGLVPRFGDDHIVFYGTKGAIHLQGYYGTGTLSHQDGSSWRDIALPADIANAIPQVKGETEQCWHILAQRFVDDILGKNVEPYPSFEHGCHYQQIIDAVRNFEGWIDHSMINRRGVL